MEILEIIGIIVLVLIIFVGGGLFGWVLKGIGTILGFLSKGWESCFNSCFTILWIILVIMVILCLLFV